MNKNSIIFSTTLNFILTISLIIISFLFLINQENSVKQEQVFEKYRPLIKFVHKQKFKFDEDFEKTLDEMNYKLFLDKEKIENILKQENINYLISRGKHKESFKIFQIDNKNYLFFIFKKQKVLIKDLESESFSNVWYLNIVFLILIFATVFLYINTIKKLLPLKKLKDKVTNLANEDFDIDFKKSSRKDEVSLLENEFKNSLEKLKNIKESRNIFIRNIMHELKTPITKGKFLINLENSEKNKEKMNLVFTRLEALINEFATIEELISGLQKIEKKPYFLEDLIDNAKDILMLEDENTLDLYENIKLNVNFKLFSIAIKNLLDNAIKYSTNEKVEIKNIGKDLYFINDGIPLEGKFENYLEPFVKKGDTNSFGLGLYIVNTILKANSYKLLYKYEDNKNIFICKKD